MPECNQGQGARYRVWIASYGNRQSRDTPQVPPEATALEPAEEETMSASEAARYVEVFNRVALTARRTIRAVALPVVVRYHGDPRPGQTLPTGKVRSLPYRDRDDGPHKSHDE